MVMRKLQALQMDVTLKSRLDATKFGDGTYGWKGASLKVKNLWLRKFLAGDKDFEVLS